MKKRLIIGLTGLCAVMIALAIVVPLLIPMEKVKPVLLRQLRDATGYEYQIDGKIELSILPNIRFAAHEVSVTSPLNKSKTPFAEMDLLDIRVKLFPLIKGRLEIISLKLQKPKLMLIQDSQKNNWSPDMQKSERLTASDVAEKKREKKGAFEKNKEMMPHENPYKQDEKERQSVPILENKIEIISGELNYTDKITNQKFEFSDIQLEIESDKYLTFDGSAIFNGIKTALKFRADSLDALIRHKQTTILAQIENSLLSAEFNGIKTGLELKGKMNLSCGSLSELQQMITGKKTEQLYPRAVHVEGDVYAAIGILRLTKAHVDIDDNKLLGSVEISTINPKPEINLNLESDSLDLSPYMNKKQAWLSLVSDAQAAEARWSSKPFDLSALQMVDATIMLKAGALTANKLKLGAFTAQANIQRGGVSIKIPNMKLFDGQAALNVSMDASNQLDGSLNATGVQIEPFINALSESPSRLRGAAKTNLVFASYGKNQQMLVSNLNGSGELRLNDGAIIGVDIASMVRNVKSAFTKQVNESKATDFAELGGTFKINKGVILNEDLAMKAPLFRATGKGSLNLPQYTLDYKLKPELVDTLKGQGGKDKVGLGVPIRISGYLDNLSYAPDLSGAIEDVLKDPSKIQDVLKNPEVMKDNVKAIRGLLKGL